MTMTLRLRLSAMMFLQYFMFGSWLVTLGTYMSQGLGFDGIIGTAYGMQGIATIVSVLLVGALALASAPVTFSKPPAGAAGAVQERFGVIRQIRMNDEIECFQVKAACCDIGRNADARAAIA